MVSLIEEDNLKEFCMEIIVCVLEIVKEVEEEYIEYIL